MRIAKLALFASVIATTVVAALASCSEDEANPGKGGGGVGAGNASSSSGQGGEGFDAGTGLSGGGIVTSDGGDDSGVCASETKTAIATPAVMLFLVDRSGSMRCNPPPIQDSAACEVTPQQADPNELSKWEITSDALGLAIAGLETDSPLPSIGLAYFNSDNYCGFPSSPDVAITALSGDAATDPHLAALQGSLAAVSPQGYTPIIGTVMGAYSFLHQNADQFTGNRFVVLLTDGAETCDPDNLALLVDKAYEASVFGIRTFVLGAPGSEGARAFLSQIAFNGGTASDPACDHSGAPADAGDCHMDMTLPGMDFATELAANLQAISAEALSCVFDVPEPDPGDPPVDPAKVNVKYSSGGGPEEYIYQDYSLPCDDPANMGWQYIDNNTKIQLCAGACEQITNDPEATISIELGCQTHEVPT
jgi:hypothetical protein